MSGIEGADQGQSWSEPVRWPFLCSLGPRPGPPTDQMLRKTLLKAFVLVYNQGQPEEGVYTLFVQVRGRG